MSETENKKEDREPRNEKPEQTAENNAAADKKGSEPGPLPDNFKFAIGKKTGMTQIFDENGNLNAATAIDISTCRVAYVRKKEKDGYFSLALGFGDAKEKNVNKPLSGIFKKYGVRPAKVIREFRVDSVEGAEPGQTVSADRFKAGDYINVQGVSKGKGFAGGMKRYNFGGGPASHGASDRERAPGSLTARRSLGRVMPGKKMAGHMGVETVTVEKVRILKSENGVIYVNAGVPGPRGSIVTLVPTTKSLPVKTNESSAKGGKK